MFHLRDYFVPECLHHVCACVIESGIGGSKVDAVESDKVCSHSWLLYN